MTRAEPLNDGLQREIGRYSHEGVSVPVRVVLSVFPAPQRAEQLGVASGGQSRMLLPLEKLLPVRSFGCLAEGHWRCEESRLGLPSPHSGLEQRRSASDHPKQTE